MYLFFLGVILGVGLALAVRSVAKTLQLRQFRKEHEQELEVQRRVNVRLGIDAWDTDSHEEYMMRGTTSGPKAPGAFVPKRHP